MPCRRLYIVLAVLFVLTLLTPSLSMGDIYRYVDKNGVCHFANIKKDGRYRLFIRTDQEDGSAYITKYEGVIVKASKRFGVEPSLIKAMIKAESDFDHRAISHKGARGLMQLMPQTAWEMEVVDLFDPQENIFGGTRYLSLMLRRFKNNTRLALAAYNAGPERVQECRGVPPIPETRAFVSRVMSYYNKYRTRAR